MKQIRYACFSDAIRDGAKLKPQAFVSYWSSQGTCAIGAGLHAMHLEDEYTKLGLVSIFEDQMCETFPYMNTLGKCPARAEWWQPKLLICICQRSTRSLLKQIHHLNDYHEWSRERIADWLFEEEEKLGFVTIDTEASNAQMISKPSPVESLDVVGSELT